MDQQDFHTLRGYHRMDQAEISYAMEDYLEMICRLVRDGKYVRVGQLSALLHVTPPSASKMAAKLRDQGMVEFEPYGIIRLTQQGVALGDYLLYRHDVLHRFFCSLNGSDDELELVEKIEHFLDKRTVSNMEKLLNDLYGMQGKGHR